MPLTLVRLNVTCHYQEVKEEEELRIIVSDFDQNYTNLTRFEYFEYLNATLLYS